MLKVCNTFGDLTGDVTQKIYSILNRWYISFECMGCMVQILDYMRTLHRFLKKRYKCLTLKKTYIIFALFDLYNLSYSKIIYHL